MLTPTCSHPREPLSLYLDGEGGPLLRLQVALRLRRCAACRAALAELRGVDRWLAEMAVEPSPGLEDALLAKARAFGAAPVDDGEGAVTPIPLAPSWPWRPAVGAVAGLAVIVAVGVGSGWLRPRTDDDLLYAHLALFEEMELIARLDMVEHFDEIQGVRLD